MREPNPFARQIEAILKPIIRSLFPRRPKREKKPVRVEGIKLHDYVDRMPAKRPRPHGGWVTRPVRTTRHGMNGSISRERRRKAAALESNTQS